MHESTRRILAFNSGRNPKMVKYKFKYMQENLFRFYRGTCHLFYEDLQNSDILPHSPLAWICGDLHLENFGSFRSGNDQIYFDLNDFDEAVLAPVAWEAVRLVTSIFIGFESLDIKKDKAIKMAKLFLKTYSATLLNGKPDYVEPATAQGIISDFLKAVSRRKQKDLLNKRTSFTHQKLQILVDNPKHFKIKNHLKADLFGHMEEWLKNDDNSPYNYKVIDAVFRLGGTGSVGLNRYAFLLKTLNKTGDKYMLLDMKQAVAPSLLPYLSVPQPAWESEAQRIIAVQKKMQNRCPALLSTSEFQGLSYVMQEMQPSKDSINFKLLKDHYRDMYTVIDRMAMLTASAQLRSSGQQGAATTDELKQFGQNTEWHEPILAYAIQYSFKARDYYGEFISDITAKQAITIGDVMP
jgi:uncharacterized protein (DUF2252 family)